MREGFVLYFITCIGNTAFIRLFAWWKNGNKLPISSVANSQANSHTKLQSKNPAHWKDNLCPYDVIQTCKTSVHAWADDCN